MADAEFKLFLVQELHGKKRKRQLQTAQVHLSTLTRIRKHVPNLDPVAIQDYLLSLYEQGRKGNYLNSYIDTLHVYGRFLNNGNYRSLKYFPIEEYEKATMSDSEIEAFLALPAPIVTRNISGKIHKYPISEKRFKIKTLFWKCLAYSGARPGEIATLTVDTVDLGRQVFLLDGKTGKRIVPIAPILKEELTAYIKDITTDKLFPFINDDVWIYDFHQRIKRLGIKRKNLTPYSLRHSFITRLLNEDLNIYKVQNLVGHKQGSPVTSQYYHLTTKALFKTILHDPMGRATLPYNERFEQFRLVVRQALSDYATSIVEEKKLLSDLMNSLH